MGTYDLPAVAAAEASAVTHVAATGNLVVLGDEGDALVEVTPTGQLVSTMTLTGFDDTEGVAALGNGQFVIVEERLQDAYRLTYAPGGTVDRAALPSASLAETVGNVGTEGIAFEPATGGYVTVKETAPQAVRGHAISFEAGTATTVDLFAPALGVADLADVAVLSSVAALAGDADAQNLLLVSQASAQLLEVSRTGTVLGTLSLAALASTAEGVAIDSLGNIYVVAEDRVGAATPSLFVFAPVPEPTAIALAAPALLCLAARRRRA